MDRRAVGQPIGPLPPYVYWRRRLVAFLVLVGAVLLLVRFVGGASAEEPQQAAANVNDALAAPTATASPTVTPAPTSTATVTPTAASTATEPAEPAPEGTAPVPAVVPASATSASGPPECDDGQLAVRVRPDAEEYPEDVRPALTIEVVNTTTTPCTQDVGAAQLEVVVMQGEARVWSSDDCSPGGTPKVELLEPGAPYTSTVNWSRQTSAPECPSGRQSVESGTYAVTGRAADVRSEAVQIELT